MFTKTICAAALLLIWLVGCTKDASHNEKRLLLLQNRHVILGLWPEGGGRIVVLRTPNGKNLLYAHPEQWASPENLPKPSATADFTALDGHIVWLGPQSEWWTQQSVNKKRRDNKSVWPPDPYLMYGRHEVKEQTATSVTMIGPASPVSGVQLTKTCKLQPDGTIHLSYEVKNTTERDVSWDIWSNTRVPGGQNVYVPANTKQPMRINDSLKVRKINGYLVLLGDASLPPGEDGTGGKLFLHPREGMVATFGDGHCFIKQASIPDEKAVHPQHAFVEVFQATKKDPKQSFTELEMHGPYETIAPGGTVTFTETWRVLPYDGVADPIAHTRFLEALGSRKLADRR